MKKITSCLFIIAAGIVATFSAYAQRSQYAEVSISSPNTASLAKYADIPVDYHTGIPDINIPIYTVTEGPLKLPVSLRYFGGGLKVEEAASWVGAGWSLDAGGVITRTVRGAPDESGTSNAQKGHFSDYGYSSYLTTGQVGGYPSSTGATAPNDYNFQLNVFDGQPDLYTFNFGAYSGKFFFDDDRRPVVVDGQDLVIDYYYPREDPNDPANNQTTRAANIYGFVISVPNGDKYYFGINKGSTASGADPVETTLPYSAGHTATTDEVFSSWYLNRIESGDGMFSIKLTYQQESYSNYNLALFPVDAEALPAPREYDLVRNNIHGVRLSQISFSNGHVDFTPAAAARTDLARYIVSEGLNEVVNTEAKALGSISISGNNNVCRKFTFSYSYFQDNATSLASPLSVYGIQTDTKHLKLDSVQEQSCDGSVASKPYKFEYSGNFIPRSLSFDRDHWGFYNAASNTNTLIPTFSRDTFTFVNGANRDSKWPEMQSGALTKVNYPTGGSTAFEFEPNTTWVNATRYTEEYGAGYSVGYDGNNNASYTNLPFNGNHYRVVLANAICPGTSPCGASAQLISSGGTVVVSITAAGGETANRVLVIPAGTYTLNMNRSDVRSGTSGAQVTFYEVVATHIQSNVIVGGLRIKKITKNNGTGINNEITNYSYNVNGQSSGVLYSKPSYVQIVRNDILAQEGPAGNTSYTNYYPHGCLALEGSRQLYYKSPVSIVPMATTQGNHIGYNEVSVGQAGNGYAIYRYYGSNLWDYNIDDIAYRNINPLQCDFSIPNTPAAPPAFEYQRGMIKYEGYFNNDSVRIKDVQYTYAFDSSKTATPAYIVERPFGSLLGTLYDMKGYWKKQEQQIETECVPGGNCFQTTKIDYYESPFHHQASRSVTTNSKGEPVETKSKYVFDYRAANCDTISNGITAYTNACLSCDAAMNATLSQNITRDYRFMARVDNRICRANARKNFAVLRKNNFTGLTNAFNTCHTSAVANANIDLKPILDLQTRLSNNLVEKTVFVNNKLTFGEYYVYGFTGTPSTIPYLSKIQLLSPLVPLTDYVPSAVTGNNTGITRDARYLDELIYLYGDGNIRERKKPGDVNNVFLWGYNSRFPLAKILGSTYNTAKGLIDQAVLDNTTGQYTDQQLRTELNKLRTGLAGALVTTYTYSPLNGITSETDPAGRTTYYEYDNLGRLKLVKDNDGKILTQYDYQYQAALTQ